MAGSVSPPLGVIDDEWQLFAAHMRLPAPVFHVFTRPVVVPDVEVPVHVYSSCIATDDLYAPIEQSDGDAPRSAPVHKSWVDALKSTSSKAEGARERKGTRNEASAEKSGANHGVSNTKMEKAAATGKTAASSKNSAPVSTASAHSSANARSNASPVTISVTSNANTPASHAASSTSSSSSTNIHNNTARATPATSTSSTGDPKQGSNVAGGSGSRTPGAAGGATAGNTNPATVSAAKSGPQTVVAKNPVQTPRPMAPATVTPSIQHHDGKTVMHTATSTIITDSKGVKTVVAKKGASSVVKPKPQQPQTVTSGFTTVTSKKTVASVVVAKPLVKSTTTSSQGGGHIVKQTVTSVAKPPALPAGLPPHLQEINSKADPPERARYYVIKSYSEDDIHKSIKYSVWASTDNGNHRLEQGWKAAQGKEPIYLFFSVNASGQFCGCAQMTSSIDYKQKLDCWADDKWSGKFSVKWLFIKDIPNRHFIHIILENNENKPVTNSRDTQEVPMEKGKDMFMIFRSFKHKTSIMDDFAFYDKRQKEMEEVKATGGPKRKEGGDEDDCEPPAPPPREQIKRKQQEEKEKEAKSKSKD